MESLAPPCASFMASCMHLRMTPFRQGSGASGWCWCKRQAGTGVWPKTYHIIWIHIILINIIYYMIMWLIIPNLILNYLDYLTRQWSIYICSLSLYICRYTRKSYICLYPSQKCELPILQHGIPFSHLGQRGKRFAIPWSRVPWCVLAGCWHDLPKHGDVSMG